MNKLAQKLVKNSHEIGFCPVFCFKLTFGKHVVTGDYLKTPETLRQTNGPTDVNRCAWGRGQQWIYIYIYVFTI